MAELFFLICLLVGACIGVALYMLPAIIAHKSKHPQRVAITVLNVLLGWSFLGWVGALVWAFVQPKP